MNAARISGNTMELVYNDLKKMSIEQLNDCLVKAVISDMPKVNRALFMNQVSFAIDQKKTGFWA